VIKIAYEPYSGSDGPIEIINLSKVKGTNPEKKRYPAINCPKCGKFMYYVLNKQVKNDTFCFDTDDPKYENFPRDFVRFCPKCHGRIGVLFLDAKIRKKFDLPLQHVCHEKIVI